MCFLLLLLGSESKADVIADANFESPASAGNWTIFGVADQDALAPGINSAVEGTETLRVQGDDPQNQSFSGVFQDIAINPNLNVGFLVTLNGIIGHTSADPIRGSNSAYLEVSFVDSMGVEFGLTPSAAITSSTPTDTYFSMTTGPVVVPTGATAVRFKAVFLEPGGNPEGTISGSAWFDNFSKVVSVPEPTSSVFLIGLGLVALSRRRR